jgi:hypothetical protein
MFDHVTGLLLYNVTVDRLGDLYRNASDAISESVDSLTNGTLIREAAVRPELDPDAFFALVNNIILAVFSRENAEWIERNAELGFDWAVDAATSVADRLDSSFDVNHPLRLLARERRSYSNSGAMYDLASDDYFDLVDNAELVDSTESNDALESSRVARDEAGVMHIQNYHQDSTSDSDVDQGKKGGATPITW